MKNRVSGFVVLLALAGASMAGIVRAQDAPTITIRKGDTVNLMLGEIAGPMGALAHTVLLNDLTVSGWFDLSNPQRATFSVTGNTPGGQLEGLVLDGAGGVVLKKIYPGDVRAAAHQFADDIVETVAGRKGIATTKIAFVSTRSGQKEIYVADYDGANVRQLTNDRAISVSPSLRPDGKALAYTGYQSGYADIYTVDLESGARKKIASFPGTNSGASFSPDGGRIACTLSKDGNPELYVLPAGGGGARRLTKTRGVESSPSWSPDGKEIVYSSDERGAPQLHRISAGGGVGTPIATGLAYNTEPNWSPDGSKIAFVTRSGGFAVAVKDLAGGGTKTVAQGTDPVWGANSRHLLFADSGGNRLLLLDTQTGKIFPIIEGMGKVSEPTWSR